MAQVGLSILAQANVLPDGLSNIVVQLPVVGLFVWFVIILLKWHRERMNDENEINRELVKLLLEIFEARLNKMSDRIELLTQTVAINTGTVHEAISAKDLADEIKKILIMGRDE